MNRLKEKKGITLIALVITMIVLLILAGVAIATLIGENGILTQSQQATAKNNKESELETIRLAVMGSLNNDGNLDLFTLVNNLTNEMPNDTQIITTKDIENNDIFPVTIIAKYGEYEVNQNGNVEKKGGVQLSTTIINFEEGGENTSEILTVRSLDEITISTVNWNVSEGLVELSENTGTSITVTKLETPTVLNSTIIATVFTSNGKTINLECKVNYIEKTISTIEITSGSTIALNPTETEKIAVQGIGRLGGIVNLTSSDISKINYTSTDINYATISNPDSITGDGIVTGVAKGTSTIRVEYNNILIGNVNVLVKRLLEEPIDLGVDVNGSGSTDDDWEILYDGSESDDATIGEKIYCILADYLPNTHNAVENAGLTKSGTSEYNVIPKTVTTPPYRGRDFINALNHASAWKELIASTYSSIDGVEVKGGLSKDVMNKIKQVRKNNEYFFAVSSEGYNIIHNCKGYWLNTSADSERYMYYVRYDGANAYDSIGYGVLPVSIIPSSEVTLAKVNGVWKITVNE